MINRQMLYSILYALSARGGREEALFGTSAPLAQQAFARSLAGSEFPEVWFEPPLAGEPWFDLHVLTERSTLDPDNPFPAGEKPFYPAAFEWFARQPDGVRQIAISHDLNNGREDEPGVQLLVSTRRPEVSCAFLEAAGNADAAQAYRAFRERMPQDWFACYVGTFPHRPAMGVRIECIPESELQQAYATDAALLEKHLRQAGFDAWDDTIPSRCQALARTPFKMEFQFDVAPDGSTGTTLGVSLRFACPPGEEDYKPFEAQGEAGRLMGLLESWGLADRRWQMFEGAMFATRVQFHGEQSLLYCYPAFVKLRWRDGAPLDAKAYFVAGVQL